MRAVAGCLKSDLVFAKVNIALTDTYLHQAHTRGSELAMFEQTQIPWVTFKRN